MSDTPESLELAQLALKVAAGAASRGTPPQPQPATGTGSGEFQVLLRELLGRQRSELPSGEFQGLLLSMLAELRGESRAHREKLEDVRVRLATGDGRMERIETQGDANTQHLAEMQSQLTALDRRFQSIERGSSSGMQRAITAAAVQAARAEVLHLARPAPAKRVSNGVLLKLIGAVAAVCSIGVGGYFTLRQTQAQAQAQIQAAVPPIDPKTLSAH